MTETIKCTASRRGRSWDLHAAEFGVYGNGPTLNRATKSLTQGLELLGVIAELNITVIMPELDAVRSAHAAYIAALNEAVQALALRRASVRDIASATGTSAEQVRQLLAEQSLPIDVHSARSAAAAHPDAPGTIAGCGPAPPQPVDSQS